MEKPKRNPARACTVCGKAGHAPVVHLAERSYCKPCFFENKVENELDRKALSKVFKIGTEVSEADTEPPKE